MRNEKESKEVYMYVCMYTCRDGMGSKQKQWGDQQENPKQQKQEED